MYSDIETEDEPVNESHKATTEPLVGGNLEKSRSYTMAIILVLAVSVLIVLAGAAFWVFRKRSQSSDQSVESGKNKKAVVKNLDKKIYKGPSKQDKQPSAPKK
jgi:flagellar basal body-associated protein FliL